jgi:endonuclease YncB( thermonuclease family)
MPTRVKTLVGLTVLLLAIASIIASMQQDEQRSDSPGGTPAPATSTGGPPAGTAAPAGPEGRAPQPEAPAGDGPAAGTSAAGPLLQPAGGGDGDSWRDTAGVEYRLGLVNTPEHDECYGSLATATREALTAGGFSAQVYNRDRHGRSIAVVTTASGINVNVHLARHGFADDTYLERFRRENLELAGQLDEAFAAARAEQAGLWGACASSGTGPDGATSQEHTPSGSAAAPAEGCHPDYLSCVPVRGDGSGRGRTNDVDCGSIGDTVVLRQAGVDPYRLDGDGDGLGCY